MFEGVRPQLPQMRTSLMAKATAFRVDAAFHSVIIYEFFCEIEVHDHLEYFSWNQITESKVISRNFC